MSTLKTTNIAHPSSASNNIVLDASGNVNIDSNTLYVDASNNRVGIGNAAPSYALDIRTTGTSISSSFTSDQSEQYIALKDSGTTIGHVRLGSTSGSMVFFAGNGERGRFDSSGRLLVGTSSWSDASRLVVQGRSDNAAAQGVIHLARGQAGSAIGSGSGLGEIFFGGNDSSLFGIIRGLADGATGSNDYPGRIEFCTTADGASSPTERMRITSGGDIGMSAGLTIGNISPAVGGFYASTGILGTGAGTNAVRYSTATGRITYDTSSRLNKEQIEDCPYGIEEVKQLQPRRYYRVDDQRSEVGFVADEVVGILPEFVPFGPKSAITGDKNDTEEIPLGVNYDKLTAVLTKALQEAIAKIETLEARLTAAGIA